MTTDIHAELKRVAARARRAAAKAWPVGTRVAWTDSTRRTLNLVGRVTSVGHCLRTGAVVLHVCVTAEEWTGKSRSIYTEVGRYVEVDPGRLTLVGPPLAPEPPPSPRRPESEEPPR